jgi:hypothetical protein
LPGNVETRPFQVFEERAVIEFEKVEHHVTARVGIEDNEINVGAGCES